VLFERYDQLTIEIGRREVFYEYNEPAMGARFFPTYKKKLQRPPTDYTHPGWVRNTYHVSFREPICKRGIRRIMKSYTRERTHELLWSV
jgi:hypothetical protein